MNRLLFALIASIAVAAVGDPPRSPPPLQLLSDDIDALVRDAAGLSPRDAASRWLRLYDRSSEAWTVARADPAARQPAEQVAARLFASLPPPTAWPELSRQIENRPPPIGDDGRVRHQALRLLGKVLNGDADDRAHALQALRDTVATGRDGLATASALELVKIEALIGGAADADGLVRRFERELEEYGELRSELLEVPDLYRLTNGGIADAMTKTAVTGRARLSLPGGKFTDGRILQLARQHVSSMKAPHFELVTDEEELDLYESMLKRFPAEGKPGPIGRLLGAEDWTDDELHAEHRTARRLLLTRAIRHARADQALQYTNAMLGDFDRADHADLDLSIGEALATRLGDVVWTDAHLHMLLTLLRNEPRAPLWETAARAAIFLKKPEAVIELLRETGARKGIAAAWQDGLKKRQWELLMRIGRHDGAADMIRTQLKLPLRPIADDVNAVLPRDADDRYDWSLGARSELAGTLAEMAAYLHKPAWLADAVAAQQASLEQASNAGDVAEMGYVALELARALQLSGQPAEAIRQLASVAPSLSPGPGVQVTSVLPDIALLYSEAGRHKEVLQLLQGAETWKARDVRELIDVPTIGRRPFGLAIASSLLNGGEREAGLKLFDAMLRDRPGADFVYPRLLESAEPADALKLLDELATATKSSPLPLAWKAETLRRMGRAKEAEAAALAALKVWPTDAIADDAVALHQAHRTLAVIQVERGADAADHQSAAKAAGLVQQAEAARAAGLVSAAIELYENAVKAYPKWPEARARLAKLYLDEGNADAAGKQAVAAAEELMKHPLERFDTESVLADVLEHKSLRQAIKQAAEARLQEEPGLTAAMLLVAIAQWRGGQHAEAAVTLRGVTTHDPRHLAAWDLLQRCGPTVADRSRAALEVLALDRDVDSTRFRPDEVLDLRRLWTLAENSPASSTGHRGPVYPLKASAEALDEAENGPATFLRMPSVPGRALSQTRLLQSLREMMFSSTPAEL